MYFKEDPPVLCRNTCFSSLATILQCCHGYIKGSPAVTEKKKSIPLTVSLLKKTRGKKTLAVLLDAAKTLAELHHMTCIFNLLFFLPTSALPPQKGSWPCSLQVWQRNTEPATQQWKRICDGRSAASPFRVSACQCGFEWAVVLIFPPFLSTLLREAEEPFGKEVQGQSKVLRPHPTAQRARSCFFPVCDLQRKSSLVDL